MPNPTKGSVHVNRPLTNISVAYANTGGFVAGEAFPQVPVAKQADSYFKYTKGDWLRAQAEQRAPGTESAGSGWNLTTDTYNATVKAIHKDIADQQRANQDSPLQLDQDATRWCTRQILLTREKDWMDAFFATGVWDIDLDGGTADFVQWENSSGDPINVVTTEHVNIMAKTGYEPNIVVVNPSVHNALKQHADIVDRIKYTQRGMVSNDLLAGLFEVDRYMVASGIEDTSTEGAAESPGFIAGKHLFLGYRAPSPSLYEPSAGYTFTWTGLMGAVQGWQVKRFRMEHLESDRVEAQSAFDQKVVATDCGAFFANAIA